MDQIFPFPGERGSSVAVLRGTAQGTSALQEKAFECCASQVEITLSAPLCVQASG